MRWLIDGRDTGQVPADDRGLTFADGVFETIRLRRGKPEAWPLHWERLSHSLAALGLPAINRSTLEQDLALLGLPQEGVLKLVLTAGSSRGGYRRPSRPLIRRLIGVSDFIPQWPEQGVTLYDCRTRLASQPATAGIKHLSRLEQVLARAEWHDERYHDGLMRDQAGCIIETTCANLLLYRAGQWLTPALDDCGVAGIMRRRVICHLERCGETVNECKLDEANLRAADEVLLVNSIRGIAPLVCFKEQTWEQGTRCRQLQQALAADTEFGMR